MTSRWLISWGSGDRLYRPYVAQSATVSDSHRRLGDDLFSGRLPDDVLVQVRIRLRKGRGYSDAAGLLSLDLVLVVLAILVEPRLDYLAGY